MKLLQVSDLHFHRPYFEWLYAHRKDYDVICISGDLLDSRLRHGFTKSEQMAWIKDWMAAFDTPLFVCSGNHDALEPPLPILDALFAETQESFDADEQASAIDTQWLWQIANPRVHGDFSQVDFAGLKIGCIPYSYEALYRFASCDLILHHLPPANTPTSHSLAGDWGCPALAAALAVGELRPRYILCGHIHEPAAHESQLQGCTILNPGSRPHAAFPQHWVLQISPGAKSAHHTWIKD